MKMFVMGTTLVLFATLAATPLMAQGRGSFANAYSNGGRAHVTASGQGNAIVRGMGSAVNGGTAIVNASGIGVRGGRADVLTTGMANGGLVNVSGHARGDFGGYGQSTMHGAALGGQAFGHDEAIGIGGGQAISGTTSIGVGGISTAFGGAYSRGLGARSINTSHGETFHGRSDVHSQAFSDSYFGRANANSTAVGISGPYRYSNARSQARSSAIFGLSNAFSSHYDVNP